MNSNEPITREEIEKRMDELARIEKGTWGISQKRQLRGKYLTT
jgi:hypothetical protein